MTAVETLDKLQRRITVSVPKAELHSEVLARLKNLARTARVSGFRPGKVPLSVMEKRYGPSVEAEVLQDKVGNVFYEAVNAAHVRVAGLPAFTPHEVTDGADAIAFDAVFEVYPDVVLGDLSTLELERITSSVDDAAIDKTLEILRKQRRTWVLRDAADGEARDGDRLTVNFIGKLDDVAFPGGSADGFEFELGEGRMLPEFETAARGQKAGATVNFDLHFPEDYQGREVAGKTAQFSLTVLKVEAPRLPELDADFAKALGIADGDMQKLRDDIRKNLEREIASRLAARNKQAAMEALLKVNSVDLPSSIVNSEIEQLMASARRDLQSRGVKDADKLPLSADLFREQAERRVRLGLIVAELVKQNELHAKPEQVRAHVESLAASYETPQDVIRWYYGDAQRLSEVESLVIENNVADFVFAQAKTTDKALSFDDVMQSA
ncbi:MAG: trigger factor [Betaproteobacteria bacterium]|jgi:trigger factor|nr:trigger factor [Betaproteobacteria bacterium]OZB46284.1 MAG: trigger factor [Thiomonas sp. 15-66-11]OZB63543.1 MAG: trigger factor [Thiomonas sp. 13-66-29]